MPKSTYEAILIDPFAKSVSKVTIERGENELKNIYDLMGCRTIDTVTPSFGAQGDRIVVDDDGLFVGGQQFFYVDGYRLGGKALYVGNFGSKFATPEIAVAELFDRISFSGDAFRQWIDTFIEEKGILTEHTFDYDSDDGFATVSLGAIVDAVCASNETVKELVKHKLVLIDFRNGDVLHFFRYLGASLAGMQKSA